MIKDMLQGIKEMEPMKTSDLQQNTVDFRDINVYYHHLIYIILVLESFLSHFISQKLKDNFPSPLLIHVYNMM